MKTIKEKMQMALAYAESEKLDWSIAFLKNLLSNTSNPCEGEITIKNYGTNKFNT